MAAVAEHFDATPFDIEGTELSHRGTHVQLRRDARRFRPAQPTALDRLAQVVRGADTDRHDLSPQAAGLLALSVGLSRLYRDDLAQLEAGMALYDALYRWARDGFDEGHDWPAGARRDRARWRELWQAIRADRLLSFGGPAAQIALMHRVLVDERRWLTEAEYLRALSFCMLLPGPEAMQLATYAGWKLRGIRGGLLAGLLFVLPGAAIILALAAGYAAWGGLPLVAGVFLGIKACVVVIVIEALLRVSSRALKARVRPGDRDAFLCRDLRAGPAVSGDHPGRRPDRGRAVSWCRTRTACAAAAFARPAGSGDRDRCCGRPRLRRWRWPGQRCCCRRGCSFPGSPS